MSHPTRGHEPIASGKILPDDDMRPLSGRAEHLGNFGPMVVGVFDRDKTAVAQQAAGSGFDHPRTV